MAGIGKCHKRGKTYKCGCHVMAGKLTNWWQTWENMEFVFVIAWEEEILFLAVYYIPSCFVFFSEISFENCSSDWLSRIQLFRQRLSNTSVKMNATMPISVMGSNTVAPRYDWRRPCYNEQQLKARQNYSKICGNEPRYNEPRYKEIPTITNRFSRS